MSCKANTQRWCLWLHRKGFTRSSVLEGLRAPTAADPRAATPPCVAGTVAAIFPSAPRGRRVRPEQPLLPCTPLGCRARHRRQLGSHDTSASEQPRHKCRENARPLPCDDGTSSQAGQWARGDPASSSGSAGPRRRAAPPRAPGLTVRRAQRSASTPRSGCGPGSGKLQAPSGAASLLKVSCLLEISNFTVGENILALLSLE